ncbi:MAG TPA: PTS transporter subunit EIIB [Epulopiscium sp.]|nr:PTS transporter subunit EIIB [Candidatus Epulonipiscium sp.]
MKKFDIKKPNRGGALDLKIVELTAAYLEKLGGADNLEDIDCCITRLRLTVKDSSIIQDSEMKALGALGVMRLSEKNVHIIIGTSADLIAEEMKRIV